MRISRPFEAVGRGTARTAGAIGRGAARAPGAIGRGAVRAIRSRVLPWTLLVLTLLGTAYLAQQWREERMEQDRSKVILAVARDFMSALTNFQAATIERDVQRIRGYAVGDFADQVDTFFNKEAVDGIKEADARSVGQVSSLFVQSLSGATASVFGVVNQIVTNQTSPTPTREVVRLDVQMIQTAAGWKVSRVEILQSPGTTPLGG